MNEGAFRIFGLYCERGHVVRFYLAADSGVLPESCERCGCRTLRQCPACRGGLPARDRLPERCSSCGNALSGAVAVPPAAPLSGRGHGALLALIAAHNPPAAAPGREGEPAGGSPAPHAAGALP